MQPHVFMCKLFLELQSSPGGEMMEYLHTPASLQETFCFDKEAFVPRADCNYKGRVSP